MKATLRKLLIKNDGIVVSYEKNSIEAVFTHCNINVIELYIDVKDH